jgi:hypothetical protein
MTKADTLAGGLKYGRPKNVGQTPPEALAKEAGAGFLAAMPSQQEAAVDPPAPGCGHVRRCVRPAGRSVREKLMGRRRVSAGAVVRVRGRDRPGPGARPPRAPAPDRQARPGADHVLYGLILSLASHEPERARMAPAWPWAACGSELKVARSGFRVWPGKPGRSGQSTGAKTVSMRPGRCLCSWQALSAARTGGMDDVAVI